MTALVHSHNGSVPLEGIVGHLTMYHGLETGSTDTTDLIGFHDRLHDRATPAAQDQTRHFPAVDLTEDEIYNRVRHKWDLSGPLPVPTFRPSCICRTEWPDWHPRLWRFFARHAQNEGRVPHRCDVSLKCTWCGYVCTFGVAIDPQTFSRMVAANGGKFPVTVHWRDGLALLAPNRGGIGDE